MATPKPSVHARDHAPGAADTIPWLERVHMIGTIAARPAPGIGNQGALYVSTDETPAGGGAPGTWYYATPVAPATAPAGATAGAAFQNGWLNVQLLDGTYAPLMYRKEPATGAARIVGAIGGGAFGAPAIDLPADLFPLTDVLQVVSGINTTSALIVTVNTSGLLIPIGPAGVGTVLLASQTLSATSASFDFAGLSAAFSHLRIYALLRGTAAAVSVNAQIRFNNDSGANYDDQAVYAHATTAGGAATSAGTSAIFGGVTASNATAGEYGIVVAELPFYTATNARKTFAGTSTSYDTAGTTSTYWTMVQGGSWRNSAAVNQVTIFPASGSWAAGSAVSVYGVA